MRRRYMLLGQTLDSMRVWDIRRAAQGIKTLPEFKKTPLYVRSKRQMAVNAAYAANAGSLIEVVNKVGSLFYGTLLGAFALAIGVKRANGTGTFVGMLAGFGTVLYAAGFTSVSYLWYNVVGALVVVIVGLLVSVAVNRR